MLATVIQLVSPEVTSIAPAWGGRAAGDREGREPFPQQPDTPEHRASWVYIPGMYPLSLLWTWFFRIAA